MSEKGGYYWDVIDYRNSKKVRLMDWDARLIYREVCDEIWVSGSVPNDPAQLSKLLQIPGDVFARVWPSIHNCLIPLKDNPDQFTSERIEQERKKRNRIRTLRKKLGQLGGKKTQAKKRASAERQETKDDKPKAIASTLVEQTSSQAKAILVQVLDTSNKNKNKNKNKKKTSLRSVKTAAPESLPVADVHREWATKNAITIDLEAESDAMLDWARGKGEKRDDWEATRRNWWRKAQKDSQLHGAKHGTRTQKPQPTENANTRAAQDFVSRELAKTLLPDIPDVREDIG